MNEPGPERPLPEPTPIGSGRQVTERMTHAAGFERFMVPDFDGPGNLYYEVRP